MAKKLFENKNLPKLPEHPIYLLGSMRMLTNDYLKFIEECHFPQEVKDNLRSNFDNRLEEMGDILEKSLLLSRIQDRLRSYLSNKEDINKVLNLCRSDENLSLIYILYALNVHAGARDQLIRFVELHLGGEYNAQVERLKNQNDPDFLWISSSFLKFFVESVRPDYLTSDPKQNRYLLATSAKEIAIPLRCLKLMLIKLNES